MPTINNTDPYGPSKEDLIDNMLHASAMLSAGGANLTPLAAAVLQVRLTQETTSSVDALRETILKLDTGNAALQRQMKWLTGVGIALAAISVVLGTIQVWEAWPR